MLKCYTSSADSSSLGMLTVYGQNVKNILDWLRMSVNRLIFTSRTHGFAGKLNNEAAWGGFLLAIAWLLPDQASHKPRTHQGYFSR